MPAESFERAAVHPLAQRDPSRCANCGSAPERHVRVDGMRRCVGGGFFAYPPREKKPVLTEEQIKQLVERFLQWKLPADFHPDAGISFEPEFNKEWNAKHGKPPQRHEPVGTNLFGYDQAEAMVRYIIEALSTPANVTAGEALAKELRSITYEHGLVLTDDSGQEPFTGQIEAFAKRVAALTRQAVADEGATGSERLEYERRILDAEMETERLKRALSTAREQCARIAETTTPEQPCDLTKASRDYIAAAIRAGIDAE